MVLKYLNNYLDSPPPWLSEEFKTRRSLRLVNVKPDSVHHSLGEFDQVVDEIENCLLKEIKGKGIQNSWEARTCDACDFRTFCNNPDPLSQKPTVP